MSGKIRLTVLLLCCAMLTACAAKTPSVADERLLSEFRSQYRNSSLVVDGTGCGSHIDASGHECHDITINSVYAGSANEASILHLEDSVVNEGERYFLFLSEGDDVHYAEDSIGYTVLSSEALRIQDNEIMWDGKRLPLGVIANEMHELGSVISAPAPVLYYDSLSDLANASDEIFIGRVADLPAFTKKTFSIRDGGNVEKAQYDTAIATIEVYSSIKGAVSRYGETLELVFSPERANAMLDATTLQPVGLTYSSATALKDNDLYLFFLKNSPDNKQSYYFLVNPAQGFVHISGDVLTPSEGNAPLRSFDTLTDVVSAIHRSFDMKQPGSDDTPLLIVEEE